MKISKVYILRSIILTCFTLICVEYSKAQTDSEVIYYPDELSEIANTLDMTPINGEVFDRPDYYGGQGLPYVFGILRRVDQSSGMIPPSVLFWCRKEEKEYLVYAVFSFSKDKYEVEELISEAMLVGHEFDLDDSFGMIAYDGVLGVEKDLSHFIYLNDRSKKGPEGILPTLRNGFMPVIIYNESSVQVLYNYKGDWLTYVEADI